MEINWLAWFPSLRRLSPVQLPLDADQEERQSTTNSESSTEEPGAPLSCRKRRSPASAALGSIPNHWVEVIGQIMIPMS